MKKKRDIKTARGRLQRLVRPIPIRVTARIDKSVRESVLILERLRASKRVSGDFLRTLAECLLGSLEIKQVSLPAVGTCVPLGVFVSKRYLKFLRALVAANRFCDREVPFHRSNEKEISHD